jgi:hypothetical protein
VVSTTERAGAEREISICFIPKLSTILLFRKSHQVGGLPIWQYSIQTLLHFIFEVTEGCPPSAFHGPFFYSASIIKEEPLVVI